MRSPGPLASLVALALLLASAALAQQGPALPPGVNILTTEPARPEVEEQGRQLAQLYEQTLYDDLELENITQLECLRSQLGRINSSNARFEVSTRAARLTFADEIVEIERTDAARTPAGRARLNLLYGQFEQVLRAAPLEPDNVYPLIEICLPVGERPKAPAVLRAAGGGYIELPAPVPLHDVVPGLPDARSAFAWARYRADLLIDGLAGAADVPATLASTEASPMLVPRFLNPAPPIAEWPAYVDRMAARYGYTDAQKAIARAVLDDLRRRADEIVARRAADFAAIDKIKHDEQRAAFRRDLNRPLDELFDELKQRLLTLASAEQRRRAESMASGQ